jgi:RNA polymerase sigma-70 factor (ECF subfamily)
LLALVPADQVVATDTKPDAKMAAKTGAEPDAEPDVDSDAAAQPDEVGARSDTEKARAAATSDSPSWTRLRAAAHTQRRRSRRRMTASVLLAAALVSVALVLPGLLTPAEQPVPSAAPAVTLTQVQPSALTAEVRLVSEPWGTRIEATCVYANAGPTSVSPGGYGAGEQDYALYVTDRSGASRQVASWGAAPGSTVEPVGTTNVVRRDIARVDIRSVASGSVLLDSQISE